MTLKHRIPWWMKIGAKIALSRLPISYRIWQRLNVFVHGQMNRNEYAWNVFTAHMNRAGVADLRGRTVLEFGPGDSLFTAVIARAFGATRTILVDADAFASSRIEPYIALSDFLVARGLRRVGLGASRTLADVLAATASEYLVDGVAGLGGIESASVDFIFSNAVMEHVPREEVATAIHEFRRILKPNGVTSHQIDLKDHLGGALNNLRFSDRTWEGPLFSSSGFYTNRLRLGDFQKLFADAGFDYEVTGVKRWTALPTPRRALAAPFAGLPDHDLLVAQFDIVARPFAPKVASAMDPVVDEGFRR